jgi:hypothetical protein
MSLTLQETFRQIDRFVNLSDGLAVRPVAEWMMMIDPSDPTEYVLSVDGMGQLMIHQLDLRGWAISPPAFVEQKKGADAFAPQGFLNRPLVRHSPQMYV